MSIIDAVTSKGNALASQSRNLRYFHMMSTGSPKIVSANDEVAFFTKLAGGAAVLGKKAVTVVSVFSQRSPKGLL